MDSDYHASAELASNSTTYNPQSVLQHGSGMFSGSQNFTVNAHTLTNITNNYTTATSLPSDFRMIPLGDIDLQHEIGSDFGAVDRRLRRPRFRRVYTAKIKGRKSSVAVAMYQGDGAEEQWRQDTAKYMVLRHPNIFQVYAAASSGVIYATLFHGDLIPLKEFVNLYRYSHVSTVYVYACCEMEFYAVGGYVYSALQRALCPWECTVWIRRSTGRLCVDLIESTDPYFHPIWGQRPAMLAMFSLSSLNMEAMASNFLTLEQYHGICAWSLSQYQRITISLLTPTKLGAVVYYSSNNPLEDPVEIASLPNVEAYLDRWESSGEAVGESMRNGWTRFRSNDVLNSIIGIYGWQMIQNSLSLAWLSQANHIFSRLRITSNFEDYVLVNGVSFAVEISGTTEDPPAGFLFLCPAKDFQTGPSSFRWPLCHTYWSFDPSGAERLNAEEATQHGFPYIRLITTIDIWYWDASIYAGLRQFHQANGFDSDSQDVARHLRNRLYQLSSKTDPSFAHMDEEDSYAEADQDSVKTDHKYEDGRSSPNHYPGEGNAIWEFCQEDV